VSSPAVSVIMPVYNGEKYLRAAVESILTQTYSDFEFLILDDGSTDRSYSIISEYDDPRIKTFSHSNRGLAGTLNRGITHALGKYVARQDQDDISLPERFEKQVEFLEAHPAVGLLGTWARIFEGNTETGRAHRHPSDNAALKFALMFDNPFVHSSMMIRKSVFDSVGVYTTDPGRQPPEDYELWSRIARVCDVANIPEFLHMYREVPKSMCRDDWNRLTDRAVDISAENMALVLGGEALDETLIDLSALVHRAYHRVSRKPSLPRMLKVLNEATSRLAKTYDVQDDRLARMARKVIGSFLKPSYMRHRYGIAGSLLYGASRLIGGLSIRAES